MEDTALNTKWKKDMMVRNIELEKTNGFEHQMEERHGDYEYWTKGTNNNSECQTKNKQQLWIPN